MNGPSASDSPTQLLEVPRSVVQELERAAQDGSTSVVEVLRQSVRYYRWKKMEEDLSAIHDGLPPVPYAEGDVVQLVKDVRQPYPPLHR